MKKLLHFVLITLLTITNFSSPLFTQAAEAPDKEAIVASINEQVSAKTAGLEQTIQDKATNQTSSIAPQQAPANTTTVTNSGDNTTTDTSSDTTTTTVVSNNNNADVTQNTNAEANTGYNTANYNISIGGDAGGIYTGDAAVNVNAEVNANNNTTNLSGGGSGASNTTGVVNTGKNVTTSTNASGTTTTIVGNNNTTIIHQATNATSNTGGNQSKGNISIGGGTAGKIVTGNAEVNVGYLVTANGNVTIIGGTGGNGGPGTGANIYITNTGKAASLLSRTNTNHYMVVTNNNKAVISQMCGVPAQKLGAVVDTGACIAQTGGNVANANINLHGDAGVIHTGDAVVNVDMYAQVNTNKTEVDGVSSGSVQNTDVVNTGNDLSVDGSSNTTTDIAIKNNNSAVVGQYVNARADTGRNTANGNIAFYGNAGMIYTGDATVNVNMKADVNTNDTEVKSASATLDPTTDSTYVYNTGDNADISTTSSSNVTKTVINNNDLALYQGVEAYATTGDNIAEGNIGCHAGIIDTGDASIDVNQDADVNHNGTYDPGVPSPSPTSFPQPTSILTPSNTIPTPTSLPQEVEVAASVKSSDSGSSSSSSSSTSSSGQVLGAATKKLPKTGAETMVFQTIVWILLLIIGRKMQNANRGYTFIYSQPMKGGEQ